MADLFGKPMDWRAPSGKEQPCQVCGAAASCGMGSQFWCVSDSPADFWPAESRARRGSADVGDVV